MMYGVKHILSFDCADKTLGVCLLGYLPEETILEHMEFIMSENNQQKKASLITQLTNAILTVKSVWLFDLIPGLNVRATEDSVRLGRLKYALRSIRTILDTASISIDQIIIEYQMGQNDLSRLISAAITYEFVDMDAGIHVNIGHQCNQKNTNTNDVNAKNIIQIGPSFKNSFHFAQHLAYSEFASKYKTSKTANKHHTAENFKYFLGLQSINNPAFAFNLKDKHSEINHIADAFMQAVYWVLHKH